MLMDMERTNKISNLINKPVLSRSGVFMGRVCDVIFNPEDMRIKGYMVKTGKVLRFTRFLSSGSVEKTDKSGIIVEGRDAFEPVSNIKKDVHAVSFMQNARGTPIPKARGEGGRISDFLFNTEIGKITHFEISEGFAEDVLHGRKKINANKGCFFGNNNNEKKDKE